MSRETDLTCYESMNRSKKSDAIVNGQSLLRMWNCPAFLSAICMGLHKRLGNTSQLQLLGKEPQLLEDVCKMLRVISLSEILSIFSCDWKPELFQHSFFLGPLGAHVPQGSLGAMARVSSGGLVLQVFAGSTDRQLTWRVDVRLAEIKVTAEMETTRNEVKIPMRAMTVHTNAEINKHLSGSVRVSDTAIVLQGGDFKFVIYMLTKADAMRTTLTSNAEFFELL